MRKRSFVREGASEAAQERAAIGVWNPTSIRRGRIDAAPTTDESKADWSRYSAPVTNKADFSLSRTRWLMMALVDRFARAIGSRE
jgi:hypothetical protein